MPPPLSIMEDTCLIRNMSMSGSPQFTRSRDLAASFSRDFGCSFPQVTLLVRLQHHNPNTLKGGMALVAQNRTSCKESLAALMSKVAPSVDTGTSLTLTDRPSVPFCPKGGCDRGATSWLQDILYIYPI
jgi:hypothetical protein